MCKPRYRSRAKAVAIWKTKYSRRSMERAGGQVVADQDISEISRKVSGLRYEAHYSSGLKASEAQDRRDKALHELCLALLREIRSLRGDVQALAEHKHNMDVL